VISSQRRDHRRLALRAGLASDDSRIAKDPVRMNFDGILHEAKADTTVDGPA
jgi:hypothetical protein